MPLFEGDLATKAESLLAREAEIVAMERAVGATLLAFIKRRFHTPTCRVNV
jgi:hypothetical protein